MLTAAHVVRGATEVLVRFQSDLPDEWSTQAREVGAHPEHDLAVLAIAAGAPVPPVQDGEVGAGSAAVLSARSVGFPRWKLRTGADDTASATRTRSIARWRRCRTGAPAH